MVRSFYLLGTQIWHPMAEHHSDPKSSLDSLNLSMDREVIKNVLLELYHKKVKLSGCKNTQSKRETLQQMD